MPLGDTRYPIKKTLDGKGDVLEKEHDKNRFLVGRDGDHLMNPYQCEKCQFQNLQQRNPILGHKVDDQLLEALRRIALDVFWSRESSTVRSNLGLVKRAARTEEKYGCVNKIIPAVGPHPLEDRDGIGACLGVLDKSMDKGRYQPEVQWETFRKMMSALTNIGKVGVGGLAEAIGVGGRNKAWMSSGSTHKLHFSRFMTGIHKRVGEDVRRDEPVSVGVIQEVHRVLEKRWRAETRRRRPSRRKLTKIAATGYWFVVGFCSGFRGEENCLLEFEGTYESLDNLFAPMKGTEKHFQSVVAGRTKGNSLSGEKFGVPCVAITGKSKLMPGIWALRYLRLLKLAGQQGGYLFPEPMVAYEEMFYSMLEDIQCRRPDLISKSLDVREAFGLFRSLRRGGASHALNMDIDERLVKAINRWQDEMHSEVPRLDMPGTYSRLDTIRPFRLRYSGGL